MYKKPCPLKDVPKHEIALRIWAYGIPISIGFLSYSLDWWEKLANARAGTDLPHDAKQLREICSSQLHRRDLVSIPAHNGRDVISRG